MNKEEFLGVLRRELLGLTPEDRNRALDYYAELIDDAVEDGQSERDATASLGDPAALAARIAFMKAHFFGETEGSHDDQ